MVSEGPRAIDTTDAADAIEEAGGVCHWLPMDDGAVLRVATFLTDQPGTYQVQGDESESDQMEAEGPLPMVAAVAESAAPPLLESAAPPLLESAAPPLLKSAAPPRGTILLLQGFGEFTEKYLPAIGLLRDLGFAVVTFDWRSQGLSYRYPESQGRGYVRSFERLCRDVEQLLLSPMLPSLPEPLWPLGHSMGGILALRLLEQRQALTAAGGSGLWRYDWSGLILSAPMLGVYRLPRWFLRTVARFQVKRGKGADFAWGAGELDPATNENKITTDQARFTQVMDLLRETPELRTHGATWGWLNEAARLMRGSVDRRRLARYQLPILLLSPGQDSIVDADLHRRFAKRCPNCEFHQLPTSMHEPLQELPEIQLVVFTAIDSFTDTILALKVAAGIAGEPTESAPTGSSARTVPTQATVR